MEADGQRIKERERVERRSEKERQTKNQMVRKRKRDREKESDRRYIKRERVGNRQRLRIGRHGRHLGDGKLFEHRWRQCERERKERGDRKVGKGKIERGKRRSVRWKQVDRERKREMRVIVGSPPSAKTPSELQLL